MMWQTAIPFFGLRVEVQRQTIKPLALVCFEVLSYILKFKLLGNCSTSHIAEYNLFLYTEIDLKVEFDKFMIQKYYLLWNF